jgi:hypothetical protein
MTIWGSCLTPTSTAWAPGRWPWRLSCARPGCGNGPTAATGSWTRTRSAGARTSHASWPQLIAVRDLASARAAIDEIIEQGEGARGDWRPTHYGRFLGIWSEYRKLRQQDPSFEPARPVIPAFTQQPYDIDQPQPQPTEPLTRRVAELFNLGYEVLLQVLTRFFTHTDETDEQLDALVQAALGIMAGVLKPWAPR